MSLFQWWKLHRASFSGLTILYWVATIPCLSRYPFNWDAAQFNLALHHYAVSMHQPHPPGYPLFVVLGKVLALGLPDNVALSLLAAIFGYSSVAVLYLFAYRLWANRWMAALVALAWAVNPMFWLYREVALTYTMDAAVSISLGYLAFLTLTTRYRRYVLFGAGVLTIAGAIRPSSLVLLLPLWLFQVWYHRRNWKLWLSGLAIIGIGTLAWLIPVVWLAGGFNDYLTLSNNLYGSAADTSSVLFGASFSTMWQEIYSVLLTIVSSVNLLLIPMAVGAWFLFRAYRRLWVFWCCWILPALFVFCFVHFGQNAYALIITIPLYIFLVPLGQVIAEQLEDWRRWLFAWLGIALLAIQLVIFLGLTPGYAHPNFFPTNRAELYLQHLARWSSLVFKWNRDSIVESDTYLAGIQQLVEQYPADQTIVITGRDMIYPSAANGLPLRNDEVFREVSYLLPGYTTFELAPERDYYLVSDQWIMDTKHETAVIVPNTTRYVLFVLDVIPSGMQPQGLYHTEPVNIAGTNHQIQVGVMDTPWTMGSIQFERSADILGR